MSSQSSRSEFVPLWVFLLVRVNARVESVCVVTVNGFMWVRAVVLSEAFRQSDQTNGFRGGSVSLSHSSSLLLFDGDAQKMCAHLVLLYQKWLMIPNVTVKQGKDMTKNSGIPKPTQLLL